MKYLLFMLLHLASDVLNSDFALMFLALTCRYVVNVNIISLSSSLQFPY